MDNRRRSPYAITHPRHGNRCPACDVDNREWRLIDRLKRAEEMLVRMRESSRRRDAMVQEFADRVMTIKGVFEEWKATDVNERVKAAQPRPTRAITDEEIADVWSRLLNEPPPPKPHE